MRMLSTAVVARQGECTATSAAADASVRTLCTLPSPAELGRLCGGTPWMHSCPVPCGSCAVQVEEAALALMQGFQTQLLVQVLQAATALALSATICHIGVESARACGIVGGGIPFITVITVLLATAVPKALTPLVPTAEGLAAILMQVGPVPDQLLHGFVNCRRIVNFGAWKLSCCQPETWLSSVLLHAFDRWMGVLLSLLGNSSIHQLPTPVCCSSKSMMSLQIFFAAIGANGSIQQVLSTAPQLFLFSLVQIAVHLVLILAAGWTLGFTRRDVLLASNANVGGECH